VTLQYGDVVLAAGGVYTGKPRPVLVFQNGLAVTGESVIVIPFTTVDSALSEYRVPCQATECNGLRKNCYLEIDKLGAIRASWLGERVGTLELELLEQARYLACRLMSPEGTELRDRLPGEVGLT